MDPDKKRRATRIVDVDFLQQKWGPLAVTRVVQVLYVFQNYNKIKATLTYVAIDAPKYTNKKPKALKFYAHKIILQQNKELSNTPLKVLSSKIKKKTSKVH